jgi:hypothetical protein
MIGRAVVVGAALVANGLLLVNDGVFWDAWIYRMNLADRRPDLLLQAHFDAGLPLRGLFQLAIGSIASDPVLLSRSLALTAIVLGGLVAYALAKRTGVLTAGESLFIACFSVVHPSLQTAVTDVVVPLVVSQTLVLVAVWLACAAEDRRGAAHLVLRVATVVVLVVAFEHKAMLSFFFGLVGVALAALATSLPIVVAATTLMRRRAELLLLPFIYYAAASAIFPQRGFYAGEYSMGELARMPRIAGKYALVTLDQARAALEGVARWPVLTALLIVPALSVRVGPTRRATDRATLLLCVAAVVWLVAAVLPFIAITRSPALRGWEARHMLPVALPLALSLVAFSRPLRARLPRIAERVPILIAAMLVTGLIVVQVTEHASWLARWEKDRGTILALSRTPDMRAFSVFFVLDEDRLGGSSYYQFYEWAAMFKSAWGAERWYGTDGVNPAALEADQKYFGPLYLLTDADASGCQAVLTLRLARDGVPNVVAGGRISQAEVDFGLQYALARLRGEGDRVVDGLIDVQARPVNACAVR